MEPRTEKLQREMRSGVLNLSKSLLRVAVGTRLSYFRRSSRQDKLRRLLPMAKVIEPRPQLVKIVADLPIRIVGVLESVNLSVQDFTDDPRPAAITSVSTRICSSRPATIAS